MYVISFESIAISNLYDFEFNVGNLQKSSIVKNLQALQFYFIYWMGYRIADGFLKFIK
jgi:hypothetical protein